jgi:hypothetical protein
MLVGEFTYALYSNFSASPKSGNLPVDFLFFIKSAFEINEISMSLTMTVFLLE